MHSLRNKRTEYDQRNHKENLEIVTKYIIVNYSTNQKNEH